MSYRCRNSGFTLIELLIVLAVLGIIATIAIPSFKTVIENNRTTTQANNLLSAIQFARSEAAKRGEDVTLSAVSSNFNNGWCVHTEAVCDNANRLREFEAKNGVAISSAANSVSFSARGSRTPQTNAEIIVSIQPADCGTGEVDRSSDVRVNLSGRAEVAKGNCI